MLLLLVQGKLTNLTVEERFAFNVSLRMFTRNIVIQRRVEDLQLGVKSYQKKLNLTKPDSYRSDLKRNEAYTAYSNPQGFIYQNKDKRNMLMRIDEQHKFSGETLIDISLTKAGNPVKKILFKLNLSDHKSILTDLQKHQDGGEGTWFQLSYKFITTCSYLTIKFKDIIFQDFRYSDESKSYQIKEGYIFFNDDDKSDDDDDSSDRSNGCQVDSGASLHQAMVAL
nr:hypothetical protein [Tanacetum cinerariifolium]